MRVLQLIAPGPMGGAERVVLCGSLGLARAGAEVTLTVIDDVRSTPATEAFIAAADVPVTRIRCKGPIDPRLLPRLRTAIEIARPQVLHVHGYKALATALLARPRSLPLVATHHGNTAHDRKVKAYEWAQLWAYRRVDHVLTVAPAVAELLRSRGVSTDRITTVVNPLALEVAGLPPPPEDTAIIQVLFIGRLSVEKGLDVLLEALPRVSERLHVRIAGDGRERESLEELARQKGLVDRVTFLGFVPDIRAELAGCHALVLPSRREALPMALLEGAAAARPFVATRTGGVEALVTQDGAAGLLATPGEVESLAGELTALVTDYPSHRAKARDSAPAIRARYDLQQWVDDTLRIYRRLTGAP